MRPFSAVSPTKNTITIAFMRYLVIALLILGLFLTGCEQDPINADGSSDGKEEPIGNLPPVTNLFLYPDSSGLDTTVSVLEVHWWGQDPDGWVAGYFVQWDYFDETVLTDSIWTTAEYMTFYLPLDSAYDEFMLTVRAVDNTAEWSYPADAHFALAEGVEGEVTAGILSFFEYEAFADNGPDPGIYDAEDEVLWEGNIEGIQTSIGAELIPVSDDDFSTFTLPPTDIEGSIDPVGDTLLFRVENTAPYVEWRVESNPPLNPGQTYQSYPTRSFFWDKFDLEGEVTIDSCFYAMDPQPGDTNWVGLPGTASSVSLTEIEPGLHRFFLKIQDIAGAQSSTISFPDTSAAFWEVLEPQGDLLIIDDYALDLSNIALNLYISIFDTLEGIEGNYSIWEMGEALPYALSDVLATLNYFDMVLWYSFYGFSHYPPALSAISSFLEGGGSMLISASQVDTTAGLIPVSEFTPGLLRVGPPNGLIPVDEEWPDLILSEFFSNEVYGLTPSENGEILYNISENVAWTLPPGMCVRRNDDMKLVFVAVPLHLLNGTGTLPVFLSKVFGEEFQ